MDRVRTPRGSTLEIGTGRDALTSAMEERMLDTPGAGSEDADAGRPEEDADMEEPRRDVIAGTVEADEDDELVEDDTAMDEEAEDVGSDEATSTGTRDVGPEVELVS